MYCSFKCTAFLFGVSLWMLAALVSCVKSDDTKTFYISDAGAVHLVLHLDNVQSEKTGQEGAKEEKDWLQSFKSKDAHSDAKKLRDAKATRIKSELVKSSRPYVALVSADFAHVDQLSKYLDAKASFQSQGKKRTFSISFENDKENQDGSAEKPPEMPYPIYKIVPENGTIEAAIGFTIREDKKSALLDIASLLKMKGKTPTISVTWVLP